MVRGPFQMYGQQLSDSTLVGCVTVKPESLRLFGARNPRARGQVIYGLAMEVDGEARDAWLLNKDGFRRMPGWMRQAYLDQLDQELSGTAQSVPFTDESAAEVESL